MKFIVIVVGLLILHRAGSLPGLQRDAWYQRWVSRLDGMQWLKSIPHGRVLLSLALPVLLVTLLLLMVDDHWFGLPQFMLSLLVFLYSLGRGDLQEQVDEYREDVKRDDLQAAYHDSAEFNQAHEAGGAENWGQLHNEVLGAVSYRYFERYFAVMFWFILAGAPGALLYRLSVLHPDMVLDKGEDKYLVNRWLRLMEWLPVRLMGLTLAFVGNFSACLDCWRNTLFSTTSSTSELISSYVAAALQSGRRHLDNPSEREAEMGDIKSLFSRVLIFSICMIALLVVLV